MSSPREEATGRTERPNYATYYSIRLAKVCCLSGGTGSGPAAIAARLISIARCQIIQRCGWTRTELPMNLWCTCHVLRHGKPYRWCAGSHTDKQYQLHSVNASTAQRTVYLGCTAIVRPADVIIGRLFPCETVDFAFHDWRWRGQCKQTDSELIRARSPSVKIVADPQSVNNVCWER